jgi:oxalate decarboxylase/phosphoglucose isomerase-like protein (cupin superfamily)
MKRQVLFCLITPLLAAQALAPEVELNAEPHHHLTLENKYVRVYNVEVPPHSDTLMHWHRKDYIFVTLGPTEVVNEVKDKPPVTLKLQDGETRFSPATFAHIASNRSDQPFRNVTIEIVDDDHLRHATSKWDPNKNEDRALETFPGGTQQILWVKDGIRASEFELQPGATVVPTQHPAGPNLLVAVSDLDIDGAVQSDVPGNVHGPMSAHFKSGDSRWLPANYSHTITNISTKPARFVTLEFP